MANTILKEHVWNPVTLGRTGSYNITATAVSSTWYNKQLDNSGSRMTRLKRYHEADTCSVEISRALDILAQDISSADADDEPIFFLDYPDESKIKKTTIAVMNAMLETWQKRTEMEEKLFDRVRQVLKYGSQFWLKCPDGTLKKLYTERMIGYILSDEDEDTVTHYIYDESLPRIEDNYGTNFRTDIIRKQKEPQIINVDDLLILKLGDKPFGESVIEKVYSTWKQLHMLETAMVIYRVVRAPEKRVYYIDTGNLQGHKREAAIEKQRLRLMQKQATRSNEITTEYDPHSTTEDIFIPTNSQGKGSRVETLAGGSNLGETGDLTWFYKKLAAGLRIPSSMIDTQSEDNGRDQYSDMRVGQVYQVEIRYLGHIMRMQRYIQAVLHKHFIDFCFDREIVPPEDMEFRITPPSSFAVYKEMEVNQTMLNVYNSSLQITSLSKKVALQKYMNFTQEDLKENEHAKLVERGLTDQQIKDIPQNLIENLVYGDGRAFAAAYGIDPEAINQDAGGF